MNKCFLSLIDDYYGRKTSLEKKRCECQLFQRQDIFYPINRTFRSGGQVVSNISQVYGVG